MPPTAWTGESRGYRAAGPALDVDALFPGAAAGWSDQQDRAESARAEPVRRRAARPARPGPPRRPWFGPGGRIRLPRAALVAGALVVLLVVVGAAAGYGRRAGNGTDVVPSDAAVSAADRTPAATSAPSASTDHLVHTGAAAKVKLGVFRRTSPSQVREFESWLGRDADYVVDFSSRDTWAEIAEPDYMIAAWRGSRYRMVYSVALLPRKDRTATMTKGSKGNYDRYYRTLGQRLVAGDQADAIIRLGWEFNLRTSHWATKDPPVFIGYWRHIVTAMRSVPGQNFRFDWNVNVGETLYDATNYYPGSRYVDYVGVDAYDISFTSGSYPYPSSCDDACRLRRQKLVWDRIYTGPFGLLFWSDFARTRGKPISLPEWGLWDRDDGHGGGDNSYFIKQMFAFVDDPQNHVAYQAYFDSEASNGEHRLTRFDSAGATFRDLFG